MLEFYLIGVIIACYLACRLFSHEGNFSQHVRIAMIIGVAFYSWLSIILIAIHIKLHYKWEVIGMYEEAIKQRKALQNK